MTFYGRIKRMEPEKTVKKIHTFQESRKTQVHWLKGGQKTYKRVGLRKRA